ncbi:MAG: transglycosylase family protein [Acidimicrobiales bacterium]
MLKPTRPAVRALAFVFVALLAITGVAGVAGATVWTPETDPVTELDGAPVSVAVAQSGGSWSVDAEGVVATSGAAEHFGDLEGVDLAAPIVDIAATPTDRGYVLAAADGGVFAFGDAVFHGSAAPYGPVSPIVGIALTPGGYWLAAADGGIFSFGDAQFYGSGATYELAAPIVDIAASDTAAGYLLLGSDGGILTFGDARFAGSLAHASDETAVSIAEVGDGYWVLNESGLIETVGDTPAAPQPNIEVPAFATGIAVSDSGKIAVSVSPAAPRVAEMTPAEAFVASLPPERVAIWDALAHCESTSRWDINTGNGFYGGIQFTLSSWRAVGGTGYPHEHSREEQIYRGELLLEIQGWRAWPGCTRKLGLR